MNLVTPSWSVYRNSIDFPPENASLLSPIKSQNVCCVSFCHKKEKGLPRSRASRTQKGQQPFFSRFQSCKKCYGGFFLLTLQSYNATFSLPFFGSQRIWYRGRFPFHFSHVLSVIFFADCQDLPDEERKKVALYLFAEK